MKRFLRDAAIPLIAVTSYLGVEYGLPAVPDVVSGVATRIEETFEAHRERQRARGEAILSALEARVRTLLPADDPASDPNQSAVPNGTDDAPASTLPSTSRSYETSRGDAPRANVPAPGYAPPLEGVPAHTREAEPNATEPINPRIPAEPVDVPESHVRASAEVPTPDVNLRAHARVPEIEARVETRHRGAGETGNEVVSNADLQHVIETRPAYELDEWRTSTLARMHAIEPIVERLAARFDTDPETIYATLLVESSLDPLAHNESEHKYGLAQVRPDVVATLERAPLAGSEVSLYDPRDNLSIFAESLAWIREETGLEDFVTLASIHSRTGQLISLDEFLDSESHARYRELVEERLPYVRSVAGACEPPNDADLDAICSVEGNAQERYRSLVEASVGRATAGENLRRAIHYGNAVRFARAYEETRGSMRVTTRAQLETYRHTHPVSSPDARAYVEAAGDVLNSELGPVLRVGSDGER